MSSIPTSFGNESDQDDASSDLSGPDSDGENSGYYSKTRRKKDMERLQEMGKQLVDFKPAELDQLPLSTPLRDAIEEAKRIKSREGLRRQLQFIGKLMRKEDSEPIEAALKKKQDSGKYFNQKHKLVEQWRDQILSEQGKQAIEAFIAQFPSADRQWLAQARRTHLKEIQNEKPPASARKLFRYLRDFVMD